MDQVPEGVDNNKGNIYLAKTSPPNVFKAYLEQYQSDFSFFLKCRSEELVEGGGLVVTLIGRIGEDPVYKDCCAVWETMAMGLNDMVKQVDNAIFCSENMLDHKGLSKLLNNGCDRVNAFAISFGKNIVILIVKVNGRGQVNIFAISIGTNIVILIIKV